MKEESMNNIYLSILAIVLAGISLGVSIFIASEHSAIPNPEFENTEWQCFSSMCTKYLTGQEWVNQNCRLNETSNEFECFVVINNQAVTVPLSVINISAVRSCAETVCILEVLTRNESGLINVTIS